MHNADFLIKNNPVILKGSPIDSSRALKYAWWFAKFRNKLATGVWRFSYFKKEGGIREAVGTRMPSLIPADKTPKCPQTNEEWRERAASIPYYDLDKQEWRSFRIDLFIGFVEPVPYVPKS